MVFELKTESSALLRAALDERFFRLWDFEGDGDYPLHRAEKDEYEKRVAHTLDTTSRDALVALALADRPLLRGSTYRGPYPFDPHGDDLRVVAIRKLELDLSRACSHLDDAAFHPALESDRLCRTVPGLWNRLSERHRLLRVTPTMVEGLRGGDDRVMSLGDFAAFPHPALRESRELVQQLCGLAGEGWEVQMALDPNRVVASSEIQDVFLKDYWWGLKLKRRDLDDLRATGTSIHGRVSGSAGDHPYPLLWTQFRWKANGHLKELEVQEVVPRETHWFGRGLYVVNRYIHSIRDTHAAGFIHLDGAAKAFCKSGYNATAADPQGVQGEPLYRKLFRIDGALPDAEWSCLVSHFYRMNELVIEYFGEVLDERPEWQAA